MTSSDRPIFIPLNDAVTSILASALVTPTRPLNSADLAPVCTRTLGGRLTSTAGPSKTRLKRSITTPPGGASRSRVTIPKNSAGPRTLSGRRASSINTGCGGEGSTSRNHISSLPPRRRSPLGSRKRVFPVAESETPKTSPSRNSSGFASFQMKLP
jgi:hypothetical protein